MSLDSFEDRLRTFERGVGDLGINLSGHERRAIAAFASAREAAQARDELSKPKYEPIAGSITHTGNIRTSILGCDGLAATAVTELYRDGGVIAFGIGSLFNASGLYYDYILHGYPNDQKNYFDFWDFPVNDVNSPPATPKIYTLPPIDPTYTACCSACGPMPLTISATGGMGFARLAGDPHQPNFTFSGVTLTWIAASAVWYGVVPVTTTAGTPPFDQTYSTYAYIWVDSSFAMTIAIPGTVATNGGFLEYTIDQTDTGTRTYASMPTGMGGLRTRSAASYDCHARTATYASQSPAGNQTLVMPTSSFAP